MPRHAEVISPVTLPVITGEMLRERRIALGMSKRALAAHLGCGLNTVTRWEQDMTWDQSNSNSARRRMIWLTLNGLEAALIGGGA